MKVGLWIVKNKAWLRNTSGEFILFDELGIAISSAKVATEINQYGLVMAAAFDTDNTPFFFTKDSQYGEYVE